MTPILAVSEGIMNGFLAAVTVLVIAGTNILTTWWANKQRDRIAVVQNNKLDVIHELSNSAMGAQKRLLAVTARSKANGTGNPVDLKAAEEAEEDLRQHELKQSAADAVTKGQ